MQATAYAPAQFAVLAALPKHQHYTAKRMFTLMAQGHDELSTLAATRFAGANAQATHMRVHSILKRYNIAL